MNFLKNAASLTGALGGGNDAPKEDSPATGAAPSPGLLANAQYLSEVAQHALKNETDQIDKTKAADAASDLLQAAKGYGLDKQGFGQYIDQADSYLKQYGSEASAIPQKTAETAGAATDTVKAAAETVETEVETAVKPPVEVPEPEEKPEPPVEATPPESGSGIEGYAKLAQQFMK